MNKQTNGRNTSLGDEDFNSEIGFKKKMEGGWKKRVNEEINNLYGEGLLIRFVKAHQCHLVRLEEGVH